MRLALRRQKSEPVSAKEAKGDTPGVLYGCENKSVAERGICKLMTNKEL
jgi:hypothetical protein